LLSRYRSKKKGHLQVLHFPINTFLLHSTINEYFDIIFWYNKKNGNLIGFQICYNKRGNEKAFTWELKTKSHHFVNTDLSEGCSGRDTMMTAILKGDAGVIENEAVENLKKYAGELDTDLMNLILDKIQEFNTIY
jgi:hypothetical protein